MSYVFEKYSAGGSGGGGTGSGIIEVDSLPTENIDENADYVLKGYSFADVYVSNNHVVTSIADLIQEINPNAVINYFVVDTLPTNPQTSDFATMSVINGYINNDIPYLYGNAGAGNMWIPINQLLASMTELTLENKGYVASKINATAEKGVYVTYLHNAKAKFAPDVIYATSEWRRKAELLSLAPHLTRKVITAEELEGVYSIPANAFYYHIETSADGNISAELSCELEEINLPDSVEMISMGAFHSCAKLKKVVANGVKRIGSSAFASCTSVTNYYFPNIKRIEDFAFFNNVSLHSVSFGNSLAFINSNAFQMPTGAEHENMTINYAGTKAQWKAVEKVGAWDYGLLNYTIYCTDGTIAKDGTET